MEKILIIFLLIILLLLSIKDLFNTTKALKKILNILTVQRN